MILYMIRKHTFVVCVIRMWNDLNEVNLVSWLISLIDRQVEFWYWIAFIYTKEHYNCK